MIEFLVNAKNILTEFIGSLKIEQITLFSIFVTFLIYTLGKSSEIKLKKHEAKKENYIKFLKLHLELFKAIRENKTKNISKLGGDFFEVGSSLLSYGSVKLYRKYLFYREINENPIAQKYKNIENGEINLYLLGDILKQIRRELSLDSFFNIISENEALSFFVNGFANNPIAKIKQAKIKHQIRMIKFELFLFDRINFVYIKRFYYFVFASFFGLIKLIFKYTFLLPFGKIILFIFPGAIKLIKK